MRSYGLLHQSQRLELLLQQSTERLIMVKLELTQTEFNYLMGLLDKRGDVLMKRTSKQSEYELAQIDYLTFKLSQTEEATQ